MKNLLQLFRFTFEDSSNGLTTSSPFFVLLLACISGFFCAVCGIALMSAAAYIIASAALHPPLYTLALAITLVRACGIGRAVFRYLDRCLSHDATFRLLTKLRTYAYSRVEQLLPLKGPGDSQGELLRHLTADIDYLKDFYLKIFAPTFIAFLLTVGTIFFLLPLSTFAAAAMLAAYMICFLLPYLFDTGSDTHKDLPQAISFYQSECIDTMRGFADIKAANCEAAVQCRLRTSAKKIEQAQQRHSQRIRLADTCIDFLLSLTLLFIFACLIPAVSKGYITGIDLAIYLLAVQTVLQELRPLPDAYRCYHKAKSCARHFFSLTPQALKAEMFSAQAPYIPSSPLQEFILTAHNVTFSYDNCPPVLQDISFQIKTGEKIAIIGESGCGKSTLFHLLLRLWNPDNGCFILNKKPYTSYKPNEIRAFFSTASQDCYIFNDTIEGNFRRLYPAITHKEITAALTSAKLDSFISGLPQGLQTSLGENACRLSGGQRQRLILAYAFASTAPILLLDEPTAGLDTKTACEVFQTILKNLSGRTLILITHDLPLLKSMNRVFILKSRKLYER